MSRTSPIARALVIAVFVATLVAVSVALGSMAPFAVPLLAALPLVIVWQWRRLRELTDSESLPWWRLLLVGIAVLAFVIVTFGGPWPESVRSALTPPFAYFIVIGLVMASFVLMGLGVLLGLVTAWRHSRSAPA